MFTDFVFLRVPSSGAEKNKWRLLDQQHALRQRNRPLGLGLASSAMLFHGSAVEFLSVRSLESLNCCTCTLLPFHIGHVCFQVWCRPCLAGNFGFFELRSLQVWFILTVVFCSIISVERGCAYCGGLGHRITECPKLEAMQTKQAGNIGRRDYLAPGAADW